MDNMNLWQWAHEVGASEATWAVATPLDRHAAIAAGKLFLAMTRVHADLALPGCQADNWPSTMERPCA